MEEFLPAYEVQLIIAEFEPDYQFDTVEVGGVLMVKTSDLEQLLDPTAFSKILSEIYA